MKNRIKDKEVKAKLNDEFKSLLKFYLIGGNETRVMSRLLLKIQKIEEKLNIRSVAEQYFDRKEIHV